MSTGPAPDDRPLWTALEGHVRDVTGLRWALHAEPDLSGDESGTRDRVLDALPEATGVTPVAGTGAVVRFGGPGPAIGLRGEMDALPVTEDPGAGASRRPGIAHACGHDVHMAALVAVARTLVEGDGPDLPLLAVLQPREETQPSGASDIVEDGVLRAQRCAAMVGAHLQPALDPGVVACVPGEVNASADEFEIRIHGTPGHAAYPHRTADPVLAVAQVVVSLQSVVSRSVDPMAAAVVGVSSLAAGTATNVVPGLARATGTLRAMTAQTRALLHTRLRAVAEDVARAHGCTAEVTITAGDPVLRNDPGLADAVGLRLSTRDVVVSTSLRSMGSDDFAYYGEVAPSVMLFVGSGTDEPLHSPAFRPSDTDLLHTARAMLAGYLGAADLVRADADL